MPVTISRLRACRWGGTERNAEQVIHQIRNIRNVDITGTIPVSVTLFRAWRNWTQRDTKEIIYQLRNIGDIDILVAIGIGIATNADTATTTAAEILPETVQYLENT